MDVSCLKLKLFLQWIQWSSFNITVRDGFEANEEFHVLIQADCLKISSFAWTWLKGLSIYWWIKYPLLSRITQLQSAQELESEYYQRKDKDANCGRLLAQYVNQMADFYNQIWPERRVREKEKVSLLQDAQASRGSSGFSNIFSLIILFYFFKIGAFSVF